MNQLGTTLIMYEVTSQEIEIIKVVRKLKAYGKVEVMMNQTGEQISVIITNPEKTTLNVARL